MTRTDWFFLSIILTLAVVLGWMWWHLGLLGVME